MEKLKKYGMSSAKPCSTPMALHPPFDVGDLCSIENAQSYRGVIGTLHYLTFNRQISFSVGKLSQHMHSPRTTHLIAAKRVLMQKESSNTSGLLFQRT